MSQPRGSRLAPFQPSPLMLRRSQPAPGPSPPPLCWLAPTRGGSRATSPATASSGTSGSLKRKCGAEPIVLEDHLKSKRAETRRAKYGNELTENFEKATLLERRSVTTPTEESYLHRVVNFYRWCDRMGTNHDHVDELEVSLLMWMEEQFFEGESVQTGTSMFAAIMYTRVDLKRTQHALPRARTALRGWKKLAPPKSRLPLPWVVTALIVNQLAYEGEMEAAVLTALTFVLYLRPSDTLGITAADVVPPLPGGPAPLRKWSLVLHAFEGGPRRRPASTTRAS